MNTELLDSSADYLTTSIPPGWERAEIQDHREREDAEMSAHFERCRRSGRPYIDFCPRSGSIRYVYFNRSEPPTRGLLEQLESLAWTCELSHYHVLKGDLFRDCFGSPEAIRFQGRFNGTSSYWSLDQIQSFVNRLSQLLPRFDRRVEINTLVQQAISAGYFTYWGNFPFGDGELEREAEATHREWCKAHDRPRITLKADEAYFAYRIFDKVLNEHAVSAIENHCNSVGLEGQYDPDGAATLNFMGTEVPPVFDDTEQAESFVVRLTEILSDPRSYRPSQP